MNAMHEANRRYWNGVADWWERLEEEGGPVATLRLVSLNLPLQEARLEWSAKWRAP